MTQALHSGYSKCGPGHGLGVSAKQQLRSHPDLMSQDLRFNNLPRRCMCAFNLGAMTRLHSTLRSLEVLGPLKAPRDPAEGPLARPLRAPRA